jgi:predicted transcriptional regulator
MTDYTKLLDLYSSPSRIKNDLCGSTLRKKYRGYFEIIALLLEAAKDNSSTRFSIMKHASINYNQLKKYLYSLIEMGFIKINKEEKQCFYMTTEKGLDFLRQYYVLLGMLLNAISKNQVNIAYEVEYHATNIKQQPGTQVVTSLQHNP